jgi:RimJ/RimL family protein N-acetyltransferase
MFCREVSREYEAKVVCDGELESLFDETLKNAVADFEADGIRFSSYMDSLVVMETERLTIRKFISDDLPALHAIMEKPEVMYAWEHGFTRSEARKWLNRQLTRYRKDGYGYFAVILKETGELAGQAGLMKNEIGGSEVVELGYIFDDRFWKQGYGLEAAKACVEYASFYVFKQQARKNGVPFPLLKPTQDERVTLSIMNNIRRYTPLCCVLSPMDMTDWQKHKQSIPYLGYKV